MTPTPITPIDFDDPRLHTTERRIFDELQKQTVLLQELCNHMVAQKLAEQTPPQQRVNRSKDKR